jgi:transcriptional regulator GlxA family with amidase domain
MDLIRNRKSSAEAQKRQFDELCVWIDAHIGEPMGWQHLMEQSGLDFQSLQTLFFLYKSTTAMTWIRHRREIARSKLD